MSTVYNNTSKLGWIAELNLNFSRSKEKTFLSKRNHIGPLTIQRPFYPEGDICHVYLLHPPGGIVGGDSLTVNTNSEEFSKALITMPGATKIYRTSQNKFSKVNQNITIQKNSVLEWLPMETIIFPGACSNISTKFSLNENAKIAAWEIQCLGRPAIQEKFNIGEINLNFEVWRDEKPIIIDKFQVNESNLDNIAGLRGYPVLGTFVLSIDDEQMVNTIRDLIPDNDLYVAGVTQMDYLIVIRCLSFKTHLIHEIFKNIWVKTRHLIAGKQASSPRIWST
tara:strand:- start:552 stop:1391 length:840 start_codon:yes stop_codon:yes gene_type:complete